MKRFIPYIALLALVVMAGCSADSPRANPAPTVVPEAWSVSSLTASSTAPFVGTVILVEATATVNGAAVPDDTTVAFDASGGDDRVRDRSEEPVRDGHLVSRELGEQAS